MTINRATFIVLAIGILLNGCLWKAQHDPAYLATLAAPHIATIKSSAKGLQPGEVVCVAAQMPTILASNLVQPKGWGR